jgi:hypothetical protein
LSKDAPEAMRGFLLNHTISDLLPAKGAGKRYSNSDPVTGQAAWFDLRVRLTKCTAAEAGMTEPQFPDLPAPPDMPKSPKVLSYGSLFRKLRAGAS